MFRRYKPLIWMLLAAAIILAAWFAIFRHQAASIECATGATEYC